MNRPPDLPRHFVLAALALAAGLALPALPGRAGTELVQFPADYRAKFALYSWTERPDRKPAIVRYYYVNPEAAAAAKAGQPAPNGTVLIMEDRKVRLGADGAPERAPNGTFMATDEVTGLFVQEKRAGWGADYPAEKRNGEWEYAQFNPDGTRRANANLDGCFACHKNRTGRDYNFTFSKWVLDGKP